MKRQAVKSIQRVISSKHISSSDPQINPSVTGVNSSFPEYSIKGPGPPDLYYDGVKQKEENLRYNEFGIQMISKCLYDQLFKGECHALNKEVYEECLKSLKKYNLGDSKEEFPDIKFSLPKLLGQDLEEHFYKIGEMESGRYRKLVDNLISKGLPEIPDVWIEQSGWTWYHKGMAEPVSHPAEDALVFDVEVCRAEGPWPTMAVAAGRGGWYLWLSNSLLHGYSAGGVSSSKQLIPLEAPRWLSALDRNESKVSERARIVVGHSVSFDRARVQEQYSVRRSGLRFLDTLSLHVCVSGVTSQQKALLKAGFDADEWSKLSSLNSLVKVHQLYCGKSLSKDEREIFISGSAADVRKNLQSLVAYCAKDVLATHSVLQKLWPLFLSRFSHPVTLAGMLELQSSIVTVDDSWKRYIDDSNATYEDLTFESKCLLSQTAKDSCRMLQDQGFKRDLWMWDYNWSTKSIRTKKNIIRKRKNEDERELNNARKITFKDVDDLTDLKYLQLCEKFYKLLITKDLLYKKQPLLPGYPEWYVKCCEKPVSSDQWIPGPTLLTNSMLVTPKLLRLSWKRAPLHYIRGHGWGYIVPFNTDIPISDERLPREEIIKSFKKSSFKMCTCPEDACLIEEGKFCKRSMGNYFGLIKVPHKDGSEFNVGNPLARDFIQKFSDLDLVGGFESARRIIEISKTLSYWRNNKERIEGQMVMWSGREGIIIPQLIVCGTLTRRAVEPTWLTLSNSRQDRVGSELRGVIRAPSGYNFVGADVDSQELWIASLLGDARAALRHGATPFGWMALNGRRAAGTDMHSVTASAIGVSRDHAKIVNYARIYGAGQRFAERTLANFNPGMASSDAAAKASAMYRMTKGKKVYTPKIGVLHDGGNRKKFTRYQALEVCKIYGKQWEQVFDCGHWEGGTESQMFNALESIANEPQPETPFLRSRLSRALEPRVDEDDRRANTRVNWVVQSSAVDFLHLMLVSMRWLIGDSARLALSFHDEVRYLVPEKEKYRVALALHATNLLVRAFCVKRVGMNDLPAAVAFFSGVEVDKTMRKDPRDDCITPSNPHGLAMGHSILDGETLDIHAALTKAEALGICL